MEQADAFTKTNSGKRICARRRETIERSFAEAKELHGLRYARTLGIRSMYEQSFLTAAVQDMKRIARAFRFPFSLLSLSIKGLFPGGNCPFVGSLTVDLILSTVWASLQALGLQGGFDYPFPSSKAAVSRTSPVCASTRT